MECVTSAAAERNKQPIAEQLLPLLPAAGQVLEIASGTGQHVLHFAARMPGIRWQPTEQSADAVAPLAARLAGEGAPGVLPPRVLDVLQADWSVPAHFDAVLAINLVHIAPWEVTPALFAGAARHLAPAGAGLVVLYGAYREGGVHTAPSNAEFDQWLKQRDPRFGVRDREAVEAVARAAGFVRVLRAAMPANNLLLAFRRG